MLDFVDLVDLVDIPQVVFFYPVDKNLDIVFLF